MINIHYFAKKIKDVSVKDLLAAGPMLLAWILSPIFREKYRHVWLVCEYPKEARDNAYHFFRYMRMNCKTQPCVYAIDHRCTDYEKIRQLGPSVQYGSLMHWILYFTAEYNIISQKGSKPNAALCSFFELSGLFRTKNVFLQHGVTKDKNDWLMADRCRFSYFVTATSTEDHFVRETFGYDPEIVHLTGFPRFDNLHDNSIVKNRIIIMPTWRKWLRQPSERNALLDHSTENSIFLRKWTELLEDKDFLKLIDTYKLDVIFYPHRNMQEHIDSFRADESRIKIASDEEYDMQELMKSAELMITDYSSVFFDMFYMKKPVIFYQFDEVEFRKYHYEEGWFDYHDNPFGKSYADHKSVIKALEDYILSDYEVSAEFQEAHKKEFIHYDRLNSERICQDLLYRK